MLAMFPMIHLVDQMTPTSPGTCHHQCSNYVRMLLNYYANMYACAYVCIYVYYIKLYIHVYASINVHMYACIY